MKTSSILRKVAVLFALLFVLFPAASRAAETHDGATSAHVRVVVQVSDDDEKKWNLALNNAKNVQQALGAGNVDIEIVAYGPGINMLKFESVVGERVDAAIKSGVTIVACQNTMKAQKLDKKDMLSTVGYVPAGVVEIIRKQGEGYAYLRP